MSFWRFRASIVLPPNTKMNSSLILNRLAWESSLSFLSSYFIKSTRFLRMLELRIKLWSQLRLLFTPVYLLEWIRRELQLFSSPKKSQLEFKVQLSSWFSFFEPIWWLCNFVWIDLGQRILFFIELSIYLQVLKSSRDVWLRQTSSSSFLS